MIEKKTVEVPATTRTDEVKICDCCGARSDAEPSAWDADPGYYQNASSAVTVASTATRYGYESDGEEVGLAWDFCPPCFETKVRPLLETLSAPRKIGETW